jgi:hypothetical protein
MAAVWKTDSRARFYGAAIKNFGTAPQVVWHNANTGDVVFHGELAVAFKFSVGQGGI